ncbi:aminotransferase class V-fold PLP-dependent enzyme [Pantanalinema sp. GBBB05]|uniref:aminotransferase class V-fold PLP-dependent enzyme n=1 Tax=Pantanalinema sp. GBBB05 TaxID=2604139 RepID=UPI001DAF5E9A|nr:aminotransferase class V-fold PLP-dependent enzyme [Pantanalinema sp. GBBB05]
MTTTPTTQRPIAEYRSQVPALQAKAYFNYGGQGPMAQSVLEAIQRSFQQVQQLGPFSGEVNDWINRETDQTRQAIAQELHVDAATITLTENVSIGCNIALWGMDWRIGDHLLLSDCEHPGIIATAQEIARRFGVEVTTCPLMKTLNAGDPVAVLAQHLRPETRMVVLSHILWNTGQVLPLTEMVAACHSYSNSVPIRVLVDAAQSVGVLPLNLTTVKADFYAFTGHKWWCGPEGVGGLYVRPGALASLHPTFIGWRGITTDTKGKPTGWKPDGRRFEIATSANPLLAGLRAAIALHHEWGTTQERYQQIQTLSRQLWQRLSELPGVTCLRTTAPYAGLVSFQLDSKAHRQLVQFLESRQIYLRTIADPDCVRACVHYFTLESELDQLVQAIAEFKPA